MSVWRLSLLLTCVPLYGSAPSEALPEDSSDSEFEFQPHIDNGHEDSEDSDVEDRPSELEAKQLPSYAAAAPPSNSLQGQYSSNRMYSTGSNPYALSAASNDSSSHSGFGFRGASSAAIDSSTDDRFGMEASKIYNRGSSSLNVQPSNAEEESAPPDQVSRRCQLSTMRVCPPDSSLCSHRLPPVFAPVFTRVHVCGSPSRLRSDDLRSRRRRRARIVEWPPPRAPTAARRSSWTGSGAHRELFTRSRRRRRRRRR